MAEQLIDGTGRGFRVGVNDSNQMRISGPAIPFSHHIAHEHQQAFFVPLSLTPTGAGSVFFYITNTDNQRDLCITRITSKVAANDFIEIYHTPTGTPTGTTVISPVNAVISSGTVANCTAYSGVAIGGLTGGTLMKRIYVPANSTSNVFELDTGLILKNGRTLFFKAGVGANQFDLNINFNLHVVEN